MVGVPDFIVSYYERVLRHEVSPEPLLDFLGVEESRSEPLVDVFGVKHPARIAPHLGPLRLAAPVVEFAYHPSVNISHDHKDFCTPVGVHGGPGKVLVGNVPLIRAGSPYAFAAVVTGSGAVLCIEGRGTPPNSLRLRPGERTGAPRHPGGGGRVLDECPTSLGNVQERELPITRFLVGRLELKPSVI